MKGAAMSEPNGYLIHGTAFSSKEAAFKALVSNHEQESWFHKVWWEDAQPYYFEPQPQLTIPKSIADELDKRWEAQNKYLQRKVTVPRDALYNAVNPYDNQLAATKIGKWIDENQNICFAYLAGKALGVDLVKVGEG